MHLRYYLVLFRGEHPIKEASMPQLVTFSSVEKLEELKTYVNDLFAKEQYAEITQAIGMHSILIDPEHTISDQDHLYRMVLNLLKKRIMNEHGTLYSSWLLAFPSLLVRVVQENIAVADAAAHSALASRHAAFGPFTSLDEFYLWALDDRRLSLDQIVAFVKKTLELQIAGTSSSA